MADAAQGASAGTGAPMISYAQNAEDVLLRRVFPSRNEGFYIDVGAHHPTVDSVTRHFYDRGWRGINIEPLPARFEQLKRERTRDLNLDVGVGRERGRLPFFECVEFPAWSTFSEQVAEEHRRSGVSFVRRVLEVRPLAEICEAHGVGAIDFLSIDVEGFEESVLAGADLRRWRPVVVVVEATRPSRPEPSHQHWEPILTAAGYVFAAFDGLNRYYLRAEDSDLRSRLAVPANVFDDFVPYRFWVWKQELDRLREEMEIVRRATSLGPRTLRLAGRLEAAVRRRRRWLDALRRPRE